MKCSSVSTTSCIFCSIKQEGGESPGTRPKCRRVCQSQKATATTTTRERHETTLDQLAACSYLAAAAAAASQLLAAARTTPMDTLLTPLFPIYLVQVRKTQDMTNPTLETSIIPTLHISYEYDTGGYVASIFSTPRRFFHSSFRQSGTSSPRVRSDFSRYPPGLV